MINHIHNKKLCSHNMCVLCIFICRNTHTHILREVFKINFNKLQLVIKLYICRATINCLNKTFIQILISGEAVVIFFKAIIIKYDSELNCVFVHVNFYCIVEHINRENKNNRFPYICQQTIDQ